MTGESQPAFSQRIGNSRGKRRGSPTTGYEQVCGTSIHQRMPSSGLPASSRNETHWATSVSNRSVQQ
jgi:hypothetical protein